MLCNALVCLAIWLTYGAHTTTDKILAIIPPIAAFVAAGFEHSVANMYFISIALLVKSDEAFVTTLDPQPDLSGLTVQSFLLDNLLPVLTRALETRRRREQNRHATFTTQEL